MSYFVNRITVWFEGMVTLREVIPNDLYAWRKKYIRKNPIFLSFMVPITNKNFCIKGGYQIEFC